MRDSADHKNREQLRDRIIGLGEQSIQKSYFPQLKRQLGELERFRALLDQSHEGLALLDLNTGRLLDFNQTMGPLLERSADELRDCTLMDLVDEETARRLRQWLDQGKPGRRHSITIEAVLPMQSGNDLPVELTVGKVEYRKQYYGMLVIHDLRARWRMEAERKELEQQLWHSQKMEAIGTLAAGIAHDFNNILAAIIGNAELLHMERVQGEDERLSQILSASLRAKQLIQQILSLGRQNVSELRPLLLSSLAKEVFKLLRASLPSTIDLRLSLNRSGDMILGDPVQIHQVLMNLCTNAAHALEEQGGSIELVLDKVHEEDADWVLLKVRDTGTGIPAELLSRIFEPYFTTKEQGKGTGLGLAVVHGIISGHQGRITVDSELGVGTTFRIQLPCLQTSASDTQVDSNVDMPRGGERLLVVDDEDVIVRLYQRLLKRLGYQVVAFTDAAEAMTWFNLNRDAVDLVLTDLTMPGMTGDELAEEVRTLRPQLPILICTGQLESAALNRMSRIEGLRILRKPVNLAHYADAIRRALDGKPEHD